MGRACADGNVNFFLKLNKRDVEVIRTLSLDDRGSTGNFSVRKRINGLRVIHGLPTPGWSCQSVAVAFPSIV